jgi:hypothetical protein
MRYFKPWLWLCLFESEFSFRFLMKCNIPVLVEKLFTKGLHPKQENKLSWVYHMYVYEFFGIKPLFCVARLTLRAEGMR